MNAEIQHRKGDEGQFFITDNNKTIGFLDYRVEGNKLIIIHTEVSDQLKGTGSARKLVDAAMEYGKSAGYEVAAECEYAAHVLKR